jgi:hypothetical protein
MHNAQAVGSHTLCLFHSKLSLNYIMSALRVMIDIEGPLGWFNISLIGRVHIDARALLDI